MNLKERADVIYLEQVNQVVIEARRLTLVMAEGRIFLITVHVCMKNIQWKRGVHVCVDTGEEDERKLFDMQHDARLD